MKPKKNICIDTSPVVEKKASDIRCQYFSRIGYNLKLWAPEGQNFLGECEISLDFNRNAEPGHGEYLYLDFICSYLISVTINYEPVDVKYEDNKIYLSDLLNVGSNIVTVCYESKYSRDGTGLHGYTDPEDKEHYSYTMLEASNAHKVFPCFDQPDLKATMTLTVYTRDSAVVMANEPVASRIGSNGNLELSFEPVDTSLGDTRTWNRWKFYSTSVLSTYLYAWCIGDFAEIKAPYTDGTVPMSLYCRRSMSKYVTGDFAYEFFNISRRSVRFLSDYMNMEYPYTKLDHVIAPEFNCGAMENVGLVIYTEVYLYKEKPTRRKVVNFTNTIYHEISHQWFGNIVTMKWWDDLWLNESFATFMSCVAQREHLDIYNRSMYEEAWLYLLGDTMWGLRKDQEAANHPIGGSTQNTIEAEATFDGISYGKGASFLKSWVKYIGEDNFREGVRHYFAKCRNGNTELKDFINSMNHANMIKRGKKETNRVPLEEWAHTWLSTKGVISLSVDSKIDDKTITLVFKQAFCNYADPVHKSFVMDIRLFFVNGKSELFEVYIEDKEFTTIKLPVLEGSHDIAAVYINSGAHAYIKPNLCTEHLNYLTNTLVYASIASTLDRQYLIEQVFTKVRDGEYSPLSYVKFLSSLTNVEPNDYIKESVYTKLATCLAFIPNCVYDIVANSVYKTLRKEYSNCTAALKPCCLDAMISIDPTKVMVEELLLPTLQDLSIGGNPVKKETLYKMLVNVSASQHVSEAVKDELVKKILTGSDSATATYLRQCEAARPNIENKMKIWSILKDPPVDLSKDAYSDYTNVFAHRDIHDIMEPFCVEYYDLLPQLFKNHLIGLNFLRGCSPGISNSEDPCVISSLQHVIDNCTNAILKSEGAALIDMNKRRQHAFKLVKDEWEDRASSFSQ